MSRREDAVDFVKRLGLYDAGNWIQMPYAFLGLFEPRDALILATVVSIIMVKYRSGEPQLPGGWYPITMKRVRKTLRDAISERTLQRSFAALREMDILYTEQDGQDNKMRINVPLLNRLTEEWGSGNVSGVSDCRKRGDKMARGGVTDVVVGGSGDVEPEGESAPYRTYSRTLRENSREGVLIRKRPETCWAEMVGLLQDAISKFKKVPRNANAHGWANHFRKIRDTDKIPLGHIWKVLRWYCQKLPEHDKYTPIAEGGEAFRRKFGSIENAMLREHEASGTVEAEEATTKKPTQVEIDDDAPASNGRGW